MLQMDGNGNQVINILHHEERAFFFLHLGLIKMFVGFYTIRIIRSHA